MFLKNVSESFSAFYFGKEGNSNVSMSSACGNGGGGGCYNCKCAPRKKA